MEIVEMNTSDQDESNAIQQAVEEFVAKLVECKSIPAFAGKTQFALEIVLEPTTVILHAGPLSSKAYLENRIAGSLQWKDITEVDF